MLGSLREIERISAHACCHSDLMCLDLGVDCVHAFVLGDSKFLLFHLAC
jgi:hypothetical protein